MQDSDKARYFRDRFYRYMIATGLMMLDMFIIITVLNNSNKLSDEVLQVVLRPALSILQVCMFLAHVTFVLVHYYLARLLWERHKSRR